MAVGAVLVRHQRHLLLSPLAVRFNKVRHHIHVIHPFQLGSHESGQKDVVDPEEWSLRSDAVHLQEDTPRERYRYTGAVLREGFLARKLRWIHAPFLARFRIAQYRHGLGPPHGADYETTVLSGRRLCHGHVLEYVNEDIVVRFEKEGSVPAVRRQPLKRHHRLQSEVPVRV